MEKPDCVTRIWDNNEIRLEFIRFTVVYANGHYLTMNSLPLDNREGIVWTGKGYPLQDKNEEEIEWAVLPPDCKEAVFIHLAEQEEKRCF